MPRIDALHRKHDAISYDMHSYLCDKLRANPDLLGKLKELNDRFMRDASLRDSRIYVEAWNDVLEAGIGPTIALALQISDWGQVMRSCSPFAAIFEPRERDKFMTDWGARYKTFEDLNGHPLFRGKQDKTADA